ncbi:hypothetical protein [Bartonella sp. TS25HLJMH]|uniref:restriction endonuclease n=1 Tax=Bartonella sp. TS25HLJMH TaxID=3243576 RepID=UPI0035D105FE
MRKINDNASEVKLFFKLPRSFKIMTLIGFYTPDLGVFKSEMARKSFILYWKQKERIASLICALKKC